MRSKSKIEGQYIFYYRNGHLCRFNPNSKGLKKDSRSEVRTAKKRLYHGKGIREIPDKLKKERDMVTPIKVPKEKIGTNEHEGAIFLQKTIGGKITVVPEQIATEENRGVRNPDYIRNNKYYDLKTTDSNKINTIKVGIKEKAKQISKNKGRRGAGGIVLDVTKTNLPNNTLKKTAISALKDTSLGGYDLFIKRKNKAIYSFRKY